MTYQLEVILVLASVGAACAVPGVFLVLRRVALVADAISHVLLFGIVLAYFVTRDLGSPWLFFGATASGVLTVALVELLRRSDRVAEDAAIGLVFPALFAIGTLLASLFLRSTHLDVDSVLLGFAEFSPTDRLEWFDELPRAVVVLLALFAVEVGLVVLFFKELKLATFDAALASTFGFAPMLLHYGLMTMTSLTAVAAFDAVGPVVVVALLVVPAATAYLLTNRLSTMIALSVGFGVLGGVLGTLLALAMNTNIAGTVASVVGLQFGVVFLIAPGQGLIAQAFRSWRHRREFPERMLAIHLHQHEGTPTEVEESRLAGLHRHLHWLPNEVLRVVRRAARHGLVEQRGECVVVTSAGRDLARESLGV